MQMPVIGGPITGTGALYGRAYSVVDLNNVTTYINYFDYITVTSGSLVGSVLVGDLYRPGLIQSAVSGDILTGGNGNDTVYGDTAPVGPYADANWATRTTAGGVDYIYGRSGNDVLNGGSGNDSIYGGSGQDTIRMHNPAAGGYGGHGYGGSGLDTLWGGVGGESLVGGEGADLIYGGAGGDMLVGEAFGSEGGSFALDRADTMYGGDGDDDITGGGGADLAYGGGGNDSIEGGSIGASVDNSRDTLFGGDGNDTVQGDEGADQVFGGAGRDVLRGNAGVDWLLGGLGNDTMDTYDDFGAVDYFVFNTALNGLTNVDTIAYWERRVDKIVLDNDVFTALGTSFELNEFRAINAGVSFASVDATDHIIYVKATGKLYYDSNGSVAGGRTLFAELRDGSEVTFGDLQWLQ
jgi:Ca2+-binding RTX toxin-like protein